MPKNDEKPPTIVGVDEDFADSEFSHHRTLGKRQEQYKETWGSGYALVTVSSEEEAAREATKRKAKKVKLKNEAKEERYQRNEHEPIRI